MKKLLLAFLFAPLLAAAQVSIWTLPRVSGSAVDLTAPGPIGSVTPDSGSFTTLSASGAVSGAGFTALFATPPAIGGTIPEAGTFTTLEAGYFVPNSPGIPTNGVYLGAANTLSFGINSANRANIDAFGIGVGRSPVASDQGVAVLSTTANARYRLGNTSNSNAADVSVNATDMYVYNLLAGNLFLGTNNTTKVTVSSAGSATFAPTADTSAIIATGNSITGSGTTSFISATGTWNTTGVVPGFVKANVTNTASGAGSRMLELQRGGTLQFGVTSGATSTGTQVRTAQQTAPTCSASCGTSPSVAGSDTSGTVTMGSAGSPASGWVVTFNGTWATAPSCVVQMGKAGMVVGKQPLTVVTTTTTFTVVTNGTAPATTDIYHYHCFGIS